MEGRGEAVPGVQEEEGVLEEEEELEEEPESARETVERILREAEEEEPDEGEEETAAEESGEEEEEEPREAKAQEEEEVEESQQPPEQQKADQKADEEVLSRDIQPPARFTAEQKEQFVKLPKWAKLAVNKAVHDTESHMTKTTMDARGAEKEAKHIVEAVRPYLLSKPELMQAGFTESTIVSGLIGSHSRLTDPKTSIDEYVQIGKNIGIDADILEEIADLRPGGAESPEIKALREQNSALESRLNNMDATLRAPVVDQVASEMQEVIDERNTDGSLRYPLLHSDDFLDKVKPLVSEAVGADPNLNYGDALRRAYYFLTGEGYPAGSQQTGLPAQQKSDNSQRQKAADAAITVRGRSAPQSNNIEQDIPEEALGSARESVEWALSQYKRG